MTDRSYPHALDAERAVLGAVLVQSDRLLEVPSLGEEDFYRDAHRRIWRQMRAMVNGGAVVDTVTLRAALERAGDLEAVGGVAYLAGLVDGLPRSTNIVHYAQIVRDKATLRGVIGAAEEMREAALAAEDDADAILARGESAIFALAQRSTGGDLVPAADAIGGVMQQIETLLETKSGVTGVPTGFKDLDAMTRGFQPATLIVLAARPSMGKTALVGNIAASVARQVGPVGFFSLEQGRDELLLRMVIGEARISGTRLLSGYVNQSDYAALSHAVGVVGQTPVWIDETGDTTALAIRSKARRMKARAGLSLVIVDYLQLLGSEQKRPENRNLEVAAMTRGFKQLAKELRVPVVLLSQLNRSLETRGEKRPTLADLRDSGAIEQDADLVLFLYRDEVYNPNTSDRGIAEVNIAKHRNGPTGTIKLAWNAEQMRFDNLAWGK